MREDRKTGLARSLRKPANTPEQKAWTALRLSRAHGLPVRRQHPVGPCVVDFAIVGRKLVIEIDGGARGLPGKAEADASRQKDIEAMGWQVMRFEDQEALSADHVLPRILSLVEG